MKVKILDSSKEPEIFNKDDIDCLNLNSAIKRNYNSQHFKNWINLQSLNELNLCNLASLCFKLRINYNSSDCLLLLKEVVDDIKEVKPNIKFVQKGVVNCGEEDLLPFKKLIEVNKESSIIYINRVIKDCLTFLGYTDAQLGELVLSVNNLLDYIPQDITKFITIQNNLSNHTYEKITEMLN